jgi:hypothetical protein
MSLSACYALFAVGAACIFIVVVAVTLVLQLARRIGVQLTDVADALATIRHDTTAIPAIGEINNDSRAMNEILAGVRQNLDRHLRGAAP